MKRPNRASKAILLASLALFPSACSRPPKGLRRLDSGDSNHAFQLDDRRRHLFYVEGGGYLVTRLGVVNLETGRRSSYRFSPEHIVGLSPSFHEDAVTVAVSGAGQKGYELLKVDADSGRVLLREPRRSVEEKDLVNFGEPVPLEEDEPRPVLASAPARPPAPAPDDGKATLGAKPVGGPRPGVKTTLLNAGRRKISFFPTDAKPENIVLSPDGAVYASSLGTDGKWKAEELNPRSGVRRTFAAFSGKIESMAYAGQGLVLLRRGDGDSGPRRLALVDAAAGRVALELPWSDGESEILGADADRRLLYVLMNEGEARTCWSVHFDEAALRAASAYLAAARAPAVRKVTETDVMALVMIGAMLVFLAAILAFAWS